MKKIKNLGMYAVIGVLGLISSCKKETTHLPTPSYDKTNLRSMIKIANPTVYNKLYGGLKTTTSTVYVTHGILKSASSECLESPSTICSVVVITTTCREASTGGDPIVLPIDGQNYSYNSDGKVGAVLILATDNVPTSLNVKSVNITDENGNSAISYETY